MVRHPFRIIVESNLSIFSIELESEFHVSILLYSTTKVELLVNFHGLDKGCQYAFSSSMIDFLLLTVLDNIE
jgi:hypothetical protein